MATNKTNFGRRWGAATAVILIAAFFRFYRLGDHPLGVFFDPAINGLDAVRLMQRGGHVLFFPTNGGRESLFIYLLIPFIRMFGSTPFALRALTATISLLTVALLFTFLKKLPITNYQLPNLFSPLTALILATSYWAIATSRLGQRPVLVPLLTIPIFWFFLRGWSTGRARWFIASGALLGLAVGYTYSAARLLPVILLLAVIPEFFIREQKTGRRVAESQTEAPPVPRATDHGPPARHPIDNSQFTNLFLLTATAVIIYLPMAAYFVTHPAQFSARADSVMVWNFLDSPAAIAAELGRNTLRVAGFFCCAGSPNPIFGLPGYPGLSPWLAPFLLIGLMVALKKWRNLFHRLVALWWLVGISPSILAIEAPHPLRMIVALPPTAILTALGLLHTASWLRHRTAETRNTPHALRLTVYAALPLLLILLHLPGLYRAYFVEWTARQDTQGVYDYSAIAIRDAVLARADTVTPIYLPLARFNDSTLLFYLSDPFRRQATTSASPAETAWVISPNKFAGEATWVRLFNGTATILPPLTDQGQHLIQTALNGDTAIPITTAGGGTAAKIAQLPIDPAQYVQGITSLPTATFGPMHLTGANLATTIDPTDPLPVTLFWEAARPIQSEFEVLLRLVDDNRRAWGNGDARPTGWVYPTSWWRPGIDRVAARHEIQFDDQPPPGRYWLAVSVFDPATGRRLPLTAGTSDSPDTFFVGPLKVPLPPPTNQPPLLAEPPLFGRIARLIGYRIWPTTAAPGESVQLELLWQANQSASLDYTVFVHLLDEAGHQLGGSDSPPVEGRYPTSIWSPGEQILDAHTLTLPPNLPASVYRLAIGLYHQPTGRRLPLQLPNHAEDPDGRFILKQPIIVGP